MNKTENEIVKSISALTELLGEDNAKDVKKRIADLIVERITSDIRSWSYYLFYPPDYEDIIAEAFESVSKKIKKKYTDAMLAVADDAVNRFRNAMITGSESNADTIEHFKYLLREYAVPQNELNEIKKMI